jgi:maltooligosyltrehalose trehalohydrolase
MPTPETQISISLTPSATTPRRLPVGAELVSGGGVHFRVWAPRARRLEVLLEAGPGAPYRIALGPDDNGYFAGIAASAASGTCYRYRLDDAERAFPDPASRFQPDGPHGPSQVVDPTAFEWSDTAWPGLVLSGQVFYELHVGTFTPEGTWGAAARQLPALAELGVTAIEVMPVAEFPGHFGWGYDGVDLFAPTRLYGEPDDFRRFVDRAHGAGLGVLLDVVYNHFGPDGCYLREFSSAWFSERHRSEWGDAINFDGADAAPVREFVVANAGYWIDEFHLDGLRLDATQSIHDASPEHILVAIARGARQAAAGRAILIVAENEPQQTRLVRAVTAGGYGLDALWNDDFHHAASVAVTGRREAYYSDYRGTPGELVAATRRGYLYQGQRSTWQRKRRGTSTAGLPPARLVNYLQNHDQVANSADGRRLHAVTSPGRWRAITAVLLLGPSTPLIFQGQEFAASAPFLYFADHEGELVGAVREGRARFLSQFRTMAASLLPPLADPDDPKTFERCKLDPEERTTHAEALALHRDLLALRRDDPTIAVQPAVDGAVLAEAAFVLRWTGDVQSDRLLLVNLGPEHLLDVLSEPLLAPPAAMAWTVRWSSEDPRYGGPGVAPIDGDAGWRLPAEAAVLLAAGPDGA